MKTLLFLAKGVEVLEAGAFIDVFGWNRTENQINTEIVTCGLTKEIISTFGIPIQVDLLLEEVKADDYAALAIPGGFEEFGFYEHAYDERVLQLIRAFKEKGKYIASICVAALPVAKSGILAGKRATSYQFGGKRQRQLAELGANVVNEPVVMDDQIITSWGPATAVEVALLLLELLTTPADADRIRELMGYKA